MNVWKLESGGTDAFAMLVSPELDDLDSDMLMTNGQAKQWRSPPKVEAFFDKRKKKQKPLGDLSHLAPGSIVLNSKAHAHLSAFLLQFGELLRLESDDDAFYFYNVTHMLDCIDLEKSEKRGSSIIKVAFITEHVPQAASIFKDPRRARSDIYLNDAGKLALEKLINEHGLTGARFELADTSRY